MGPRVYPRVLAAVVVCGLAGSAGCKKRPLAERPDEHGKLNRVANRLEEAYASAPLPPLEESPRFADRLSKWDDFRGCTVRAYVARKRDADRAAREGRARPSRFASIGEEAVEECAVEAAVIKKDATWCERLAIDFARPDGLPSAGALRCWDHRARVLGRPEECPVVWLPNDVLARNVECLALAHRDRSLCPFAEYPSRCQALFGGACGPDAPPDCAAAATYWSDLIPAALGKPMLDDAKTKAAELVLDLTWPDGTGEAPLHLVAPKLVSRVSWPAGRAEEPAHPRYAAEFWGSELAHGAAALAFRGQPAVRLAFVPSGELTGTRALQPPGPEAAATIVLVWADPRGVRRCVPASDTTGEVQFSVTTPDGALRAGAFLEGTVKAERLACSDGRTARVTGRFSVPILDLR
jgi:hypothetical protein